jgi:hypothetical protein
VFKISTDPQFVEKVRDVRPSTCANKFRLV